VLHRLAQLSKIDWTNGKAGSFTFRDKLAEYERYLILSSAVNAQRKLPALSVPAAASVAGTTALTHASRKVT